MPYTSNDKLPYHVKIELSDEQQTIWRRAFNDAVAANADYMEASWIAYTAVTNVGPVQN